MQKVIVLSGGRLRQSSSLFVESSDYPFYVSNGKVALGTTETNAVFTIYGGSLSTTAGSRLGIARFYGSASNSVYLSVDLHRVSNGSDWTTAPILIQRRTDVTDQAYIALHGTNVGINSLAPRSTLTVGGSIEVGGGGEFIISSGPLGIGKGAIFTRSLSTLLPGDNNGFAMYLGRNDGEGPTSATAGIECSWQNGGNPALDIGVTRDGARAHIRMDYTGAIYFMTGALTQARLLNNNLSVAGGIYVGNSAGQPLYQIHLSSDSAAKPGTNVWTVISDIRTKKNIQPYTKGVDYIRSLPKPINFQYNGFAGTPVDNVVYAGYIGQEVWKVDPTMITIQNSPMSSGSNEDNLPLLTVNTNQLTYAFHNAIVELAEQVEALKVQIASIKGES